MHCIRLYPIKNNARGRHNSAVTIMDFIEPLPIDSSLPELTAALRAHAAAVLVAPPGAGKTTRVPLVLAEEVWACGRKIIVLEPRRLAARAAAMKPTENGGTSTDATATPA